MKEGKICIYPGCFNLAVHSSYCREHDNLKSRERHKLRYKQLNGLVCKVKCTICGKDYMTTSNHNVHCPECRNKINEQNQNDTKYVAKTQNGVKIDEHRQIAKHVGVITQKDDVVHHMDGNKSNNDPSNLVVLSSSDHGRLHAYLRAECLKQPTKSIVQLSWEFILQNYIPYCQCSSVPGYHFPTDDVEQ